MKRFGIVSLLSLFFATNVWGAGLSGSVTVNQDSETAARAKINAMNTARRQILFNVLSQYSDSEELAELMEKTSNDDLMNLVVSTSVSDEHISPTAYSANISMNIDNDAARKWLMTNDVKNWVPSMEYSEKYTAFIVLSNTLPDWAELKRIARSENIEIETQSIIGNQIVAKMPLNYRTRFTAGLHDAGWHYTDNNGVLQIWR